MTITITTNTRAVSTWLQSIVTRQLPFALTQTVNSLAFKVREDAHAEMRSVFDRPTPFALRSMEVIKARSKSQSAWVGLNLDDRFHRALAHQFTGGDRRWKRMEGALLAKGLMLPGMIAVPPRNPRPEDVNAYGNIKPSRVVQLISYFGAFGEQGYRANMTDSRKSQLAKRKRSKQGYVTIGGVEYILSRGKGRNNNLPAGIWAKTGTHGVVIKPVLLFVRKGTYQRRIDLHRIGTEALKRDGHRLFRESLGRAVLNDRSLMRAMAS